MNPTFASTILQSRAQAGLSIGASGLQSASSGRLNDLQLDKAPGTSAWLNTLQAATASPADLNHRQAEATNSSNELNGLAMKGMAVNAAIRKAESDLAGTENTSAIEDVQSAESLKKQEQHKQAILRAQQLMAQTFFGPMLKQMRQSPFKSELFSGGRGGEAFASLFDQELTERMSRGAGSKLVNAIVRKLEKRGSESMEMMQFDPKLAADEQAKKNSNAVQSIQQSGNTPGNVRIHVAPNLGN